MTYKRTENLGYSLHSPVVSSLYNVHMQVTSDIIAWLNCWH